MPSPPAVESLLDPRPNLRAIADQGGGRRLRAIRRPRIRRSCCWCASRCCRVRETFTAKANKRPEMMADALALTARHPGRIDAPASFLRPGRRR